MVAAIGAPSKDASLLVKAKNDEHDDDPAAFEQAGPFSVNSALRVSMKRHTTTFSVSLRWKTD